MDLRKLKTLIDLVSESEVSELEITEAEGKVRIVKGGGSVMVSAPQVVHSAPAVAAAPVAAAPAAAAPASAVSITPMPIRKVIIPAGQPLPPQPSANEISPEALASVREVEKRAKRLTLMELTERTCKWPIGDPATDDFWFCGLPSVPGKPYCEAHVGVAFQPMSARRDRRR